MLEIFLRILNSFTFHYQSYFYIILFFFIFSSVFFLIKCEYYNLFLNFLFIFMSSFFIIACQDFFYYPLIYKIIFISFFFYFLCILIKLLSNFSIIKYKFDGSVNNSFNEDNEIILTGLLILLISFLECVEGFFNVLSIASFIGVLFFLIVRYLYFYFDTYIFSLIDMQFDNELSKFSRHILNVLVYLINFFILIYFAGCWHIFRLYLNIYFWFFVLFFLMLFSPYVFFILEKLAVKVVVNTNFSNADRVRTLNGFFQMIFKILYIIILLTLIFGINWFHSFFTTFTFLAIAFQDFFRSLVNGLLVLFEDSVNIGEFVEIGGVSGEVQEISLRIIKLRDFEGSLFIVPFHKIDIIRNRGKDFVYVVFKISVSPRSNVNEVLKLMQDAFDNIKKNENFKSSFLKEIEIIGLSNISSAGMVFEARVKIRPANTRMIRAAYYKELEILFSEKNIAFGYEYWLVANKKGITLSNARK